MTDSQGNIKTSANAVLNSFTMAAKAEDPSQDNMLSFQTGTRANQSIRVGLRDMRSYALGLSDKDGSAIQVGTQEKANAAINVFDNAIACALDEQTTIGAVKSRLEMTVNNLTIAAENTRDAVSTIRDADMAKEMTEYTKTNVLLQAAQAMLGQANQNASSVLSLLQ